jgi:hypothetical protein
MEIYYVNSVIQPSGYNEVHISSCQKQPGIFNRKCLGQHPSSKEAIKQAEKFFPKVNQCTFCLPHDNTNK